MEESISVTNPEAIWIGWGFSFVVLLVTFAVVIWMRVKHKHNREGLSYQVLLMAGTAVACFALVHTQLVAGLKTAEGEWPAIEAFLDTVSMFTGGGQISIHSDYLGFMGPFAKVYVFYDALLFVIASAATIVFIFSLVGSIFTVPRIWFHSCKNRTYVFSELNPRTFILAKSLMEKYKDKSFFVFCNQTEEDQALEDEMREAAEESHGAIVMFAKRNIAATWGYLSPRNDARTLIFGSEDEKANLDKTLQIIGGVESRLQSGKGTWPSTPLDIYLFSTSRVDGIALDARMSEFYEKTKAYSPDGKGLAVRAMRINAVQQTVNRLIDTMPVFLAGERIYAITDKSGAAIELEPINHYQGASRHVVIVGDTEFTREYLKGLLWSSRLGDDLYVKITYLAADACEEAEHCLRLEMPGIFNRITRQSDEENLGKTDTGYALAFRSADPTKEEFAECLRDFCSDATLVVVDRDDDRASAETAMRVRELLESAAIRQAANGWDSEPLPVPMSPCVYAVIHDGRLAEAVKLMKTSKKPQTPYAVRPICTDAEVYHCDNLLDGGMFYLAAKINRLYCYSPQVDAAVNAHLCDRFDEWDVNIVKSEYDRNSSLASALHLKYGLYVFCRKYLSGDLAPVGQKIDLDESTLLRIDWRKPLCELYEKGSGPGFAVNPLKNAFGMALEAYDAYMNSEEVLAALSATDGFPVAYTWRVRMEHDRWVAQTLAEGNETADESLIAYFGSGIHRVQATERETYAPIAKAHACLVDFDDLSQVHSFTKKNKGEIEIVDKVIANNMLPILGSKIDEDSSR